MGYPEISGQMIIFFMHYRIFTKTSQLNIDNLST